MKPAAPLVTAYLDFGSLLKDWFQYRKEIQPVKGALVQFNQARSLDEKNFFSWVNDPHRHSPTAPGAGKAGYGGARLKACDAKPMPLCG